MIRIQGRKPHKVSDYGAAAGAVLCGFGLSNKGLRLQILEDQPRGNPGALRGKFVILDVGDNIHKELLEPLLNQTTDAEEVLHLLRSHRPNCLNVANASILVPVEPQVAAAGV